MPQSKRQNPLPYSLRGGELKGEGGFGCVFDLQDLQKLIALPRINVGFEFIQEKPVKQFRRLNSATSAISRTDNDASLFDADDGSYSDDHNNARQLKDLVGDTAAKRKVVKVFVSKTAYDAEKSELALVKGIVERSGAEFAKFFPSFYQAGYVSWDAYDEATSSQVARRLACNKIFRAIRNETDENPNFHTIFFVIMEKMDFSLKDLLTQKKYYTSAERFLQKIMDLVVRMKEMHALGIVHCDIKPQNIMASTEGTLFFVDLGSAQTTQKFKTTGSTVRSRKFSIVFSPDDDDDTERKFDEELLMDIDPCFKYQVCRILGIKNIRYLVETFRNKKYEASSTKNANARKRQEDDLLLYVDNFAMAMTIVHFVVFYGNETNANRSTIRKSAIKRLDAVVRDLFTQVGKVTLQFPEEAKISNENDIEHSCRTKTNVVDIATNAVPLKNKQRQQNNAKESALIKARRYVPQNARGNAGVDPMAYLGM